jgi:hypothetical protein
VERDGVKIYSELFFSLTETKFKLLIFVTDRILYFFLILKINNCIAEILKINNLTPDELPESKEFNRNFENGGFFFSL